MRWGLRALVLTVSLVSSPVEGLAVIRLGGLDAPTSANDVEVVGDRAYVAGYIRVPTPPGTQWPFDFYGVLRVVDVSNPALPIELGALENDTPGRFHDVEVVGDRAYVATQIGLLVIDVSDPTLPVEIGALATPTYDVEVVGDRAYAVGAGLSVIDVSNPELPVELCTLGTPAYHVEVVGDLAYVAEGYGLRVFDISNGCDPPPVEVGALELTWLGAFDLAVVGDRAYAVGAGLSVIDVSNPAQPVLLSPPGSGLASWPDVEVVGDRAYVATQTGLLVFDVSNPALPVEILALATPTYDVEVVGDRAYAAGNVPVLQDGGLWEAYGALSVFDVSNPAFPAEIGSLETPWVAYDVELVGKRAYVVGHSLTQSDHLLLAGLRVIDVSNPALPVELGALDWEGYALGVEVVGNLAYVNSRPGLRVIDVSDPALPVELCTLDMWVRDLEVIGDLVYMAGSGGLHVIDASDPCLPVELAILETEWIAYDVEVVGNLAYLADSTVVPPPEPPGPVKHYGLLRVIDVSDPELPVEIGSLETPWVAYDIEVVGKRAYAAGDDGLFVIDVSNPELPVEIGALEARGGHDLDVVGDRAYVVSPEPGGRGVLRVIDLSNPALPAELLALALPMEMDARAVPAYDVEVRDDLAYVAGGIDVPVQFPPQEGIDDYGVLRVIDFGPEYRTPIAVEIDIQPWSEANRIKPFSRGIIPVALLGSDGFDVANLEVTTLAFGPGEAPPAFDLTNPWVFFLSHWDVNHDGRKDLLSYYRSEDTGITMGDTQACLTGKTLDGTPLEGCDAITTLPGCGHGFEAALVLPPVAWIGGRIRRRRMSRPASRSPRAGRG